MITICSGCVDANYQPTTNVVVTLATQEQCPSPFDVSLDRDTGIVYAACSDGGVVAITRGTVTTVTNRNICPYPYSVSVDSNTGIVYAGCGGGGVIGITSVNIIPVASSAQCESASDVHVDDTARIGSVVYAACNNNIISIYGGVVTTLTTVTQCPGASSVFVDSSPSNRFSRAPRLLSTCRFGNSSVISIERGIITPLVLASQCRPQGGSGSVSVDRSTDTVYVACSDIGVISIHKGTIEIIVPITLCPNPTSVFLTSTTNNGKIFTFLYVTCFDGGVIRVNTDTPRVFITIANPKQCPNPQNILVISSSERDADVSSDGKIVDTAYVACFDGGVISVTITSPAEALSSAILNDLSSGYSSGIIIAFVIIVAALGVLMIVYYVINRMGQTQTEREELVSLRGNQ